MQSITMNEIAKDPIIELYLRMSKSTESEYSLPTFSDTRLRLSFKEILGKLRPIYPKEILLYRKLLLIHYAEIYENSSDLLMIMGCFTNTELDDYLLHFSDVIKEWKIFIKENLVNALCKDAFVGILCEWARRYIDLHGELEMETLRERGTELRKFLNWEVRYYQPSIKRVESILLDPNSAENLKKKNITDKRDLDFSKIVTDIKHKLNPIVLINMLGKQRNSAKEEDQLKIGPVKNTTKVYTRNNSAHLAYNKSRVTNVEIIEEPIQSRNVMDDILSDAGSDAIEIDTSTVASCDNVMFEVLEPHCNAYHDMFETCNILRDDASTSSYADVAGWDAKGAERIEAGENVSCNLQAIKADSSSSNNMESDYINYETALQYLTELQAYAVINGQFEALNYLDKVDVLLRTSLSN